MSDYVFYEYIKEMPVIKHIGDQYTCSRMAVEASAASHGIKVQVKQLENSLYKMFYIRDSGEYSVSSGMGEYITEEEAWIDSVPRFSLFSVLTKDEYNLRYESDIPIVSQSDLFRKREVAIRYDNRVQTFYTLKSTPTPLWFDPFTFVDVATILQEYAFRTSLKKVRLYRSRHGGQESLKHVVSMLS